LADDIRPQVQTSLGDAYTIERELGGGGMSRTYVAMERSLSRRVVVKVLSPELAAGVSVDRFKREILLAAQMQHPHVVPVLSSGDASGLPWFTMPYVEGESLRTRLVRGPLATGEAVSVLRDVARALAFAHGRGVVHRDIKPDNVLLSEGSATVTDFGIAKAISAARTGVGAETLTMAGTSIGTPAYMAPEQAAGDPNIDHRSDIYAFGCMAYEVLTGRPPFIGQSPAKLLGAQLGEKPRDVRELRADTPESLAALVMQSLEKDPAARPQQAGDLVRVLDTVTSSGAAMAAPGILAGRIPIGKALGLWAAASALVALTAWAATTVIGLPDWVLPGSLGIMLAGLPIIAFTAWVQRVAHRAYTATPTFTPGGTAAQPQGTLHTIAIKASPHVSWKRTWMGGAVAVGAFVVLVVGWMVMRALGIGPAGSLLGAGKLGAGDQIIITDFRSPADDSTLGLHVTEALRADLSQSTVLRVMPRLAVIDILRLMQRPVESRIDFDLARAIASREGLKAVLDGDIVSLGGRYLLSTRLISQDGSQLATFSEAAESQNDLIPAIGRLGKQLRARVGESLKSVREAGALDRVTTGSMDALRKYAAANLVFEQTGDYTQAIPLLREAVQVDSTFAMAWRRLALYYSNTFRFEQAQAAAVQAFKYADRLSEVERQLTIAAYHSLGPTPDNEKALAAYEAVLARDSLNFIALNNASLILANRREREKALTYRLRAAAQPGTSPLSFGNAVSGAVVLGRWEVVDSLQREFVRRFPNNPAALRSPASTAAVRGEYDRAGQLLAEIVPRISGSRTAMITHLGFTADLALVRGKVRESLRQRADQRSRQLQAGGGANARLQIGLDSVIAAAVVLEDRARARELLSRTVQRAPVDSIAYLDRNYDLYLAFAALAADTTRAREWHSAARESWAKSGNLISRPAWEAYDDAMLALAHGRYADALTSLNESDRRNMPRTDVLGAARFLVLDRLQQADSAIAAGESYLADTHPGRLGQDALFLAGIRQRLGEMYEAKGEVEKALTHYLAFVELWKDADPELQPRVRDVRSRVERLQRRRG
jgi:tetratricopeptide (TPR) repeat protein/tRNA A-37 threonylcarbamoyl transferase component Bud32